MFKTTKNTVQVVINESIGKSRRYDYKQILLLAWPVTVTQWLYTTALMTSSFFVGTWAGGQALAGVLMGNTLYNITGLSIGLGLATAVDIQSAQLFGAKRYRQISHVAQQGFVILALVCLPIYALWLNAENILLSIGVDHERAHLVGQYLGIMFFKMPIDFVQLLLIKYLQAQSILAPQICGGVATNIASAFFNYLFVRHLGWGFIGAPIAATLASLANVLTVIGLMFTFGWHKASWQKPSRAALRDFWPFFSLAIPGMVMTCLEWWGFEINLLLAGSLNSDYTDTQGIVMMYGSCVFAVALGIGIATSILVGQSLGAGEYSKAKKLFKSGVILTALIDFFLLWWILLAIKNSAAYPFTSSEVIAKLVSATLPAVAICSLLEGAQFVCLCVVRAVGKPKILAWTTLVNFYIIGMPIGYVLARYTSLSINGLWLGIFIAQSLQAAIALYVIFKLNWKTVSDEIIAAESKEVSLQIENNKPFRKEEIVFLASVLALLLLTLALGIRARYLFPAN